LSTAKIKGSRSDDEGRRVVACKEKENLSKKKGLESNICRGGKRKLGVKRKKLERSSQ